LDIKSAEWNQNRIKHLDFLAEQQRNKLQVKSDFMDMEDVIREILSQNNLIIIKSSSTQKNYEQTYIAGSIIESAVLSKFM
jgi:hypothetical protein